LGTIGFCPVVFKKTVTQTAKGVADGVVSKQVERLAVFRFRGGQEFVSIGLNFFEFWPVADYVDYTATKDSRDDCVRYEPKEVKR